MSLFKCICRCSSAALSLFQCTHVVRTETFTLDHRQSLLWNIYNYVTTTFALDQRQIYTLEQWRRWNSDKLLWNIDTLEQRQRCAGTATVTVQTHFVVVQMHLSLLFQCEHDAVLYILIIVCGPMQRLTSHDHLFHEVPRTGPGFKSMHTMVSFSLVMYWN